MNPADRQIFYFNIDDMNWELYLKNLIPGMRLYLAKESMDTLETARARYRKYVLSLREYVLSF